MRKKFSKNCEVWNSIFSIWSVFLTRNSLDSENSSVKFINFNYQQLKKKFYKFWSKCSNSVLYWLILHKVVTSFIHQKSHQGLIFIFFLPGNTLLWETEPEKHTRIYSHLGVSTVIINTRGSICCVVEGLNYKLLLIQNSSGRSFIVHMDPHTFWNCRWTNAGGTNVRCLEI